MIIISQKLVQIVMASSMTLKVGYEMLHYNNEMYLAMNTSNLLMKLVEIICYVIPTPEYPGEQDLCSVVSVFNGHYGHEGVGNLGGTEQSAYDLTHNVYVSIHIVQFACCRGYS